MRRLVESLWSTAVSPSERASMPALWRSVWITRPIIVASLAALSFSQLNSPFLKVLTIVLVTVNVCFVAYIMKRFQFLPPLVTIVDVLFVSAVIHQAPNQYFPAMGIAAVITIYAAATFGRRIGVATALVSGVSVIVALATTRSELLPLAFVYASTMTASAWLCGEVSDSASRTQSTTRRILADVDLVLWESRGTSQTPYVLEGPVERVLGYPIESHFIEGFWQNLVHPEDRHIVDIDRIETGAGRNHRLLYRFLTRTNGYIWIDESVHVDTDHAGRITGQRGVMRNVTDDVEADLARDRYASFIAELPTGIAIYHLVDPEDPTSLTIVAANKAVDPMADAPLSTSIGQRLIDVAPRSFSPRSDPPIGMLTARVALGTETIKIPRAPIFGRDGREYVASITLRPLPDRHVSVTSEDITDLAQAQVELERKVYIDQLTGLPNRVRFHELIATAVPGALICVLDLDQFKEVNDTFGHACGDLLLREVGRTLQDGLQGKASIARLGGDEFAVLLNDPFEADTSTAAFGHHLVSLLQQPLPLPNGLSLLASVSVGVATVSQDVDGVLLSADELMRRADVAMYQAKRSSRGCVVYESGLDSYSPRRVMLMAEVRDALRNGQIQLHYQPIVNAKTRVTERVEALVRWHHPTLGILGPNEFVELTELNNLNEEMVLTAARNALLDLKRWTKHHHTISVSINVGGATLLNPRLIDQLIELVENADVAHHAFGIELTERQLHLESATSTDAISRLRDAGIWLSIDDFGTGTSSLAMLRHLPVNELKIDKVFVDDLRSGHSSLITSMVTMAHELGLYVVAEGVEDDVTLRWLREAGADAVQGFIIARPAPADDFERWLQDEASRRRSSRTKDRTIES